MKLQNSLYTIDHRGQDGGAWCYQITLDSTHVIYQAHFPEQPITPGVCIIQIAKELLEDALQQPLDVSRIKNVKFLSVISPKETSTVTYVISKLSEDGADYKAIVEVKAGQTTLAKISFVCSKHEGN